MTGEGAPLRIGLATDWYPPRQGGIELHVADLARSLTARGHHPLVLTSTPAATGGTDDPFVRRLPVRRLPLAGIAMDTGLPHRLREVIRRERVDVIHAHVSVVSPVAYGAILAARRLGVPAVLTFHSVLHSSAHVLALLDRLLGWRAWGVRVTAVSEHVAAQLREVVPGLDVAVLPNGVDTGYWRALERVANDARVHLVTAMRLHRKKRPRALVEAFLEARRRAPAAAMRLTIFGEGPERGAVARMVERARAGDEVTLAGHASRDALRAAYASAHGFVLPTAREAFGLAALEARCAGLPVVAMRHSGVADFLRHDENALLARDDRELSAHVARLATDRALRERLAACDGGVARLDWSLVGDQHLAVYREAVERSAAARPSSATVGSARPIGN